MKYPITVKYTPYEDSYDEDMNRIEEVIDKEGHTLYRVMDLTECPEDATLFRDIPDASEAISLIKFGMRLKYMGYDDLEIVYQKEER